MSEDVRYEMLKTPETAAAVIARKCRESEQFSDRLTASPKEVLEEMSGKSLPAAMNVQLHHNDDQHWVIPIPSRELADKLRPLMHEGSISDEQLREVSGGAVSLVVFGITAGAIIGIATVAAVGATAGAIHAAQK